MEKKYIEPKLLDFESKNIKKIMRKAKSDCLFTKDFKCADCKNNLECFVLYCSPDLNCQDDVRNLLKKVSMCLYG